MLNYVEGINDLHTCSACVPLVVGWVPELVIIFEGENKGRMRSYLSRRYVHESEWRIRKNAGCSVCTYVSIPLMVGVNRGLQRRFPPSRQKRSHSSSECIVVLQIAFCSNSSYNHNQPYIITWHQLTFQLPKWNPNSTRRYPDALRIRHAKAFLHKNPDKQPVTTTRIYNLPLTTL